MLRWFWCTQTRALLPVPRFTAAEAVRCAATSDLCLLPSRAIHNLDSEDRGQVAGGFLPSVALIGTDEDRAAIRAEIDARRFPCVA